MLSVKWKIADVHIRELLDYFTLHTVGRRFL